MGGARLGLGNAGVRAGLLAAVLFGVSTPFAKALLGDVGPWLLAALLYLGSGLGLGAYRLATRAERVRLAGSGRVWFAAAVTFGGILAPVLLMIGLDGMPASGASLLLNAESVATALIAWMVFGENVDRRVAGGMAAIAAGAVVLSWPGSASFAGLWPAMAILGACSCWAIDNNLTRKVSLTDATWLAAVKGAVAGTVNLLLAVAVGAHWPAPRVWLGAGLLGFISYGVSLALFVVALRELGTARAGAYFAAAPFLGAVLSVLVLGEAVTAQLVGAGAMMAVGVWLHLSERHSHEHTHEAMEHQHRHQHGDGHHEHPGGEGDSHPHVHPPVSHSHPHYPDAHHRHPH